MVTSREILKAIFIFLISLSSLSAQVESGLDVCDCPEIESLSREVASILEQTYEDQEEVPPFSFDQFNLTLAIQLDSTTPTNCLDQFTEALSPQEEEAPDLSMLPDQLQFYRQAGLEGRIMVYHAEVDGVDRVFILRRNEDGEVTVESFDAPQVAIENPEEIVPPVDPTYRIERRDNGLTYGRVLPTDGGNLVETRLGFTCQGRQNIDGTCDASSVAFNGGATLTFGLDGPVDPNAPPSGRELEFSADVTETYSVDGTRLNRQLATGVTYTDDDRAYSLNITDDEHTVSRYDFQGGNAGLNGHNITGVRGELAIQRPELFHLTPDGSSSGPPSGGGKGEPPVPSDGELNGPQPGVVSLYHFGLTGEFDGGPERLTFGLAERDGEESNYLLGSADFRSEHYELNLGAGDSESRFNFELDQSLYGGLDSTFLTQREIELEEGTRTLTFSHEYDGQLEEPGIHTLSADRVDQRTTEGEYTNGDTRRIIVADQRGIELSSEGRVVLSFGQAVTETQIREGVPVRGPGGEQAGTQDIDVAFSSYTHLISASAGPDSQFGIDALIASEQGTGFDSQGYTIGVSLSEEESGRSASTYAVLTNSRGVFGSPCSELSAEATISEGFTRGRELPQAPRGAGPDGLACRYRYTNTDGQVSQEFLISRHQQFPGGGYLTQEYGFLSRPNGNTEGVLNIRGEILLCGGFPCR
jgi:hypothetical protein